MIRGYRLQWDGVGDPKEAMIEALIAAGNPPDDPHCGPGVYFIAAYPDRFSDAQANRVKIGRSGDVLRRLADLQTGYPGHLSLLHVIHQPDETQRRVIESDLHQRFRRLHVHGEWFQWAEDLNEFIGGLCEEHCHW